MAAKAELSEHGGLVIKGSRIVVPRVMRKEILEKIHKGHQGLTKSRERAKESVRWSGISTEQKNAVMSCQTCRELRNTQQKEPLISTPLPERPWKRIAVDLCEYKRLKYLIVSDYYSRFLEILHLPPTTMSYVTQRERQTSLLLQSSQWN